jgi:hypothetical protein
MRDPKETRLDAYETSGTSPPSKHPDTTATTAADERGDQTQHPAEELDLCRQYEVPDFMLAERALLSVYYNFGRLRGDATEGAKEAEALWHEVRKWGDKYLGLDTSSDEYNATSDGQWAEVRK